MIRSSACWPSRSGTPLLDYKEVSSDYVFATAALVLALSVAYWLAVVKNPLIESHGEL